MWAARGAVRPRRRRGRRELPRHGGPRGLLTVHKDHHWERAARWSRKAAVGCGGAGLPGGARGCVRPVLPNHQLRIHSECRADGRGDVQVGREVSSAAERRKPTTTIHN